MEVDPAFPSPHSGECGQKICGWPSAGPRDPFPHLSAAKLDFILPEPPAAWFDISACAMGSPGGILEYTFEELGFRNKKDRLAMAFLNHAATKMDFGGFSNAELRDLRSLNQYMNASNNNNHNNINNNSSSNYNYNHNFNQYYNNQHYNNLNSSNSNNNNNSTNRNNIMNSVNSNNHYRNSIINSSSNNDNYINNGNSSNNHHYNNNNIINIKNRNHSSSSNNGNNKNTYNGISNSNSSPTSSNNNNNKHNSKNNANSNFDLNNDSKNYNLNYISKHSNNNGSNNNNHNSSGNSNNNNNSSSSNNNNGINYHTTAMQMPDLRDLTRADVNGGGGGGGSGGEFYSGKATKGYRYTQMTNNKQQTPPKPPLPNVLSRSDAPGKICNGKSRGWRSTAQASSRGRSDPAATSLARFANGTALRNGLGNEFANRGKSGGSSRFPSLGQYGDGGLTQLPPPPPLPPPVLRPPTNSVVNHLTSSQKEGDTVGRNRGYESHFFTDAHGGHFS